MTKPQFNPAAITEIAFQGVTCGTINQFVVIGLADDRYSVQWCAIGDPTDWPTPNTDDARSKQSGKQSLPSKFGEVTGISGDDFFGYVFQERAITKMAYVGGDVVFTFDTFEEGRGCFQLNRYDRVDDLVIFESEYGYHAVQDGQVLDIGYGIVDDSYTPQSATEQKSVCINEAISCAFFEDQNLVYNYKTQQWSRTPAYAGDKYFKVNGAGKLVGRTVLFTTLGSITDQEGGAAQTGTVTTGANDVNQGGRTIVNGVRPLYNGGTHAVRVGVQDNISDAVTWSSTATPLARTGYANLITEGRYVRAEIVTSGGFTTGLGADLKVAKGGKV